VLEDDLLRGRLLGAMPDPQIRAMCRTYFTPLDHRFRLEIINPVQTRVYKFAANLVARSIGGQSRSTIDPQAWVRDGAIVVVDVAKERVGADIAAMLGGTLVNLVATALGQQATLPPDYRRHVALLVDEFHALPAANYEAFLAELAKYGASLVLATQSLGALDAVNPQRGLRNAVLANVGDLFAFNCSAEDARSLALELGAPIEPTDLIELGDYQCYARLSTGGERLPAFHLRLDAPPVSDRVVRDLVTAASGARYGRDAAVVAADRAAMLERLEVQPWSESSHDDALAEVHHLIGRHATGELVDIARVRASVEQSVELWGRSSHEIQSIFDGFQASSFAEQDTRLRKCLDLLELERPRVLRSEPRAVDGDEVPGVVAWILQRTRDALTEADLQSPVPVRLPEIMTLRGF
jgi:hypothetical protein